VKDLLVVEALSEVVEVAEHLLGLEVYQGRLIHCSPPPMGPLLHLHIRIEDEVGVHFVDLEAAEGIFYLFLLLVLL
jgi:hypothetical protein